MMAIFWLAAAVASTCVFRAESATQHEVLRTARAVELQQRSPTSLKVIQLAGDPDQAVVAFARAVAVDSIVAAPETGRDQPASGLLLMRSITAYLTPGLHPNGDYGAELLANQERLARAGEAGPIPGALLQRERAAARALVLAGLRTRAGFQDYRFSLHLLEMTALRHNGLPEGERGR